MINKMKVWTRPSIYLISHILLGFLSYFYPEVLYATIGYQFLQYFFNVRFFLFEGIFRQGNSLEHTSVKLTEVAIGYGLAMLSKALNII